jgi:hypothetical protein
MPRVNSTLRHDEIDRGVCFQLPTLISPNMGFLAAYGHLTESVPKNKVAKRVEQGSK